MVQYPKNNARSPALSALSLVVFSLVPRFAEAAKADEAPLPVKLDGITVTAQKREQSIKDVPISIFAVVGQDIEKQNFTDFERMSTRIPGFFVQQQTDSSASFVMRGIEAGNAGAVSEPSISFFLNDVDTSRSRGMLKELFDIERVEVAKGPQGTLYGRGAQIGAIAVYTRKADLSNREWQTEGQLGNYGLYSGTAIYNAPLIKDELGLRVAVRRRERSGYVRNLSGGDKLNDDAMLAGRFSLRWRPIEALSLDLIVDHQADDDHAVMTKAINVASPGGDVSPFSDAAQSTYGPPDRRRQTGVTVLADWSVSDAWQLRSISAWREVKFAESWDADGTSYPFLIGRNLADDQRIFSQEIRLGYDPGGVFRANFGGGYYRDDAHNLTEFTVSEQYLLGSFPRGLRPVTEFMGLPVTQGVATLGSITNRRQSMSIYANVAWDMLPVLTLDAGLRYTRDHARIWNWSQVSTIDGIAPLVLPNGFGNSLGQQFSKGDTFNLLQPRAALTWKLNKQINLYAGVSRGLRSGYPQITFDAPLNGKASPHPGAVSTEEVLSYEVGAKGTVGSRFYFDAAAFTYDYNDFQTRGIDITLPVVNAGKASARGLELTGSLQLLRSLTLTSAYAYLHTRYDKFTELVDGALEDRAGNVFRMAPRHTASVSLDWRAPAFGRWESFASGSYAWRSHYFLNNDNLESESQKAFGLLDLRAGLERSGGGVILEVYAENALNTEWVRDVGNSGKSFGIPTSIRANPRMFGVRLRLQGWGEAK